jgi:hypothetical protein
MLNQANAHSYSVQNPFVAFSSAVLMRNDGKFQSIKYSKFAIDAVATYVKLRSPGPTEDLSDSEGLLLKQRRSGEIENKLRRGDVIICRPNLHQNYYVKQVKED